MADEGETLAQALEAHRRGDLFAAEKRYRDVLALAPDHADALALLGVVLSSVGKAAQASLCLERAISLDPSAALFRFYQGNVRMAAGDYVGAIEAYNEALLLAPAQAPFAYNLGNAYRLAGAWDKAKEAYETTLKIDPNHTEAMNNLSLVYERGGSVDEAVAWLEKAVTAAPAYGEGWLNLCNLAEKAGRFDRSAEAARRALALMPDNPSASFGLGVALNRLGKDEEALASYREALRLKPEWAEGWDNLGQTCQSLNRLDDAENAFRRAIGADGQTMADEGSRRVDESEYGHRHWHLALLELLKGDYVRGFARYRARFKDVGGLSRLSCPQPVWQGEDIAGKTILVMDEQGLGDALMLARFLPLLKARGARVVFLAHPALVPLFHGWNGSDVLIARGHPLPAFDVYASIFDLPYAFGTTVESVPAAVPYLPAPEVEAGMRLPEDGAKKVALCWAGAPLHKQDARRTIPLAALAPLIRAAGAGVRFYSLTRDKRQGDEALMQSFGIVDLAPRLFNMAHTAQAVLQMDLTITCDTSTAHLAGGLGRPVWTLLPFAPDWRWLLDRSDSPWYPTMCLLRQPMRGDWAGAMGKAPRLFDNDG